LTWTEVPHYYNLRAARLEALKIFEESYETISFLIQSRISKLGSLDESDDEKIGDSNLAHKEMSKFIGNLKKLITSYKMACKIYNGTRMEGASGFNSLTAWKYVFKIYDFLVKNQFITQEQYRGIFQDNKIVDEVIYFTTASVQRESMKISIPSSLILTETYIWPYLSYFSGM
jgi:hypothetical protein